VECVTTSIPCRIWLVSHSTSAASAASRFADIDSADMFSVYLYFTDHCWLQQQRTDQLPTDSTGYTEKCVITVRGMLKLTTVSLLWVSYVCRVSSCFANLASFLAGTCTTTVWLSWRQMLWRTTQACNTCESVGGQGRTSDWFIFAFVLVYPLKHSHISSIHELHFSQCYKATKPELGKSRKWCWL